MNEHDDEQDERHEREERAGSWELPLEPGGELQATFGAHAVVVRSIGPGERPRVEARGRWGGTADITVARVGRTVEVRAEGAGLPFFGIFGGARARVHLYLPADVRAVVRTHFGAIKVRQLAVKELELVTDAGRIVARGVEGHLRARTAAGPVILDHFRGTFDLESAAGAIRVGALDLDPGVHRAHTDAGAVRVELPRGLVVHVDARTDFGRARIDHPVTPEAMIGLLLSSGAGAVRVSTSSRDAEQAVASPMLPGAPYRWAATTPDAELEKVLEMVASGTLSPTDARDLIRALGV